MSTKKVKDDEGNEYEIELEDDDGDDDEDEDDENIYLTESDLRWLKEARKAAGLDSQKQNGKDSKQKKSPSGIAVKKRPSSPNGQTDSTSQKKSRVKRLTLSR
jgi:hypothetical protein